MALTDPPIIEMIDIAKHYGHIRALEGVSITSGPARSPACWATTAPASPR